MYRSIQKYSTVILATAILAACGGGGGGGSDYGCLLYTSPSPRDR